MFEYRKTAILNPFVPTDGGQLLLENVTVVTEDPVEGSPYTEISTSDLEERLREWEQMQSPDYLHMVGTEELTGQTFPVKEPVVDGLLYKGVYLSAGAPRIGKPFLVLQTAYAVSTGQTTWDYQAHRETVFHPALEDQYRRLQERMVQMFGVDDHGDLMLAMTVKRLSQGLEQQMKYLLKRYPRVQMIATDTLQKVREMTGERYSHIGDYEVTGQLRTFADFHNIYILIVYHTRKQQAEDNFKITPGTIGLLGRTDGVLLLYKEKRTDHRATPNVVSRGQLDQRLHLLRNERNLTWILGGANRKLWRELPGPSSEQVVQLVMPEQPA